MPALPGRPMTDTCYTRHTRKRNSKGKVVSRTSTDPDCWISSKDQAKEKARRLFIFG